MAYKLTNFNFFLNLFFEKYIYNNNIKVNNFVDSYKNFKNYSSSEKKQFNLTELKMRPK